MDRYLSTMNCDGSEQVFKRGLCLIFGFCLQSGEMIRTREREKRPGRRSVWVLRKSHFDTGPQMQSGLARLKDRWLFHDLENFPFHQIQDSDEVFADLYFPAMKKKQQHMRVWGGGGAWLHLIPVIHYTFVYITPSMKKIIILFLQQFQLTQLLWKAIF